MTIRVLGFEQRPNNAGVWHDYVHITASSNITSTGAIAVSTWWRIKDIEPRDSVDASSLKGTHMRVVWSVVGPAYEAWKTGNAIPETGTPLAAWSGITQEQAAVLRQFGVRTVEEMRDASDTVVSKLPIPSARDLKRLAGEWLAGKGTADLIERLAQLEAQNAAMVEMLSDREEPEPAKRGPGRPPKAKAEETA